jgi:riboflavin synthase
MVAIIPHTWDVTTMHRLHEGDNVNVEFDIVGKYVRRSIEAWQAVVRS